MYVGLWSRLQGLTRDQLTDALERRKIVQGTLMRATIHLVSRRDYLVGQHLHSPHGQHCDDHGAVSVS